MNMAISTTYDPYRLDLGTLELLIALQKSLEHTGT